MPIEKINVIVYKNTDYDSINPIVNKLNELIEAHNNKEEWTLAQSGRLIERIRKLEPQTTNSECDDTICQINPCPWCGSYDIKFIDFGFDNSSFRGECMNCQAHNAPSKTKQEAINAWNKRK